MRIVLILLLAINTMYISLVNGMKKFDAIEIKQTVKDVFHAIKQKDPEKLAILIQSTPELIKENKKGIYPIHKAAKKGYVDILECLLKGGAEVDQRTYWGEGALTFAAKDGNLEMVISLISYGANVYQKDQWWHRPINYAIFNGHKKVVKFFLDNSPDVKQYFVDQQLYYAGRSRGTNNLLTIASMQGHKKIVRWLLQAGAPVKIDDPYDVRHLQRAAKKGYYDIAKMLLEHGAEVDDHSNILGPYCEDIDEPPALMSAVFKGHYNIVELLLNYGADKEKRYCGRTPLKHAKRSGYLDIVELLKKHKYRLMNVSISIETDELSDKQSIEISSVC